MSCAINDLCIEPVLTEREINYIVSREGDYLFRLVPDGNGFSVSKMDRCLDTDADAALIDVISEMIVQNEL